MALIPLGSLLAVSLPSKMHPSVGILCSAWLLPSPSEQREIKEQQKQWTALNSFSCSTVIVRRGGVLEDRDAFYFSFTCLQKIWWLLLMMFLRAHIEKGQLMIYGKTTFLFILFSPKGMQGLGTEHSVTRLVQLLPIWQCLNLLFINISAYKLVIINIACS